AGLSAPPAGRGRHRFDPLRCARGGHTGGCQRHLSGSHLAFPGSRSLHMLDHSDLATYARGMAAALRVMGATPRAHVLGMLRSLQLTEEEAEAAIRHGLALGVLHEEGDDLLAPAGERLHAEA